MDDIDLLCDRINEIDCIEEDDGRFYYNPFIKPKSSDRLANTIIESYLEAEILKIEKHLKEKLDGD